MRYGFKIDNAWCPSDGTSPTNMPCLRLDARSSGKWYMYNFQVGNDCSSTTNTQMSARHTSDLVDTRHAPKGMMDASLGTFQSCTTDANGVHIEMYGGARTGGCHRRADVNVVCDPSMLQSRLVEVRGSCDYTMTIHDASVCLHTFLFV